MHVIEYAREGKVDVETRTTTKKEAEVLELCHKPLARFATGRQNRSAARSAGNAMLIPAYGKPDS